MRLILASQSPRRLQLLSLLGVDFAPRTPRCDEHCEGSARQRAGALALRKAAAVSREIESPCFILGADTLVEKDGVVYGKPRDERDAARMLGELSGQWHRVYTGIALIDTRHPGREAVRVECTRVHFAPMGERFIADYVASGEPMDKAGAYGIQGRAVAHIDRIEGDYFNVVGLPVHQVHRLFEAFDVYNAIVEDKLYE